ncbi:MAG: AMP-binding protein [Flavobacteriales bacterium]|nr:AMP-binding protein [Flavobacteriales bacterium]
MTNIHPAFNDLLQSFENYKDRIAIVDKDGTEYSYSDFKQHIVGAREILAQKGIKKGDKILVAVPMSLQLYAILEAILSMGAVAVFLDPWMKGKKMSAVIHQVKPDLFIVTKKIAKVSWLLRATWKLKKWKVDSIAPSSGELSIAAVEDNDNALITFTSGTSGTPKGANRTFAFLQAQAEVLKSHLKRADDQPYVDYTNFPIVGLADFAMGNTVVIPRINLMKIHKADSDDIANHLIEVKANRLIVSPSLLKRILIGLKGTNQNHHIAELVTGGAPISNELILNCLEELPTVKSEGIYGSTESEPICVTDFEQIKNKLQTPLKGVFVGRPVNEIEVKIVKWKNRPIETSEFENLIKTDGEVGEVVVKGDHVNKHYYQNEAAFKANKIVDSNGEIWHRTGDMAYLENGDLYLVGRSHRIMRRQDKNFYPYPLEQFIEQKFGLTDLGYVKLTDGRFVLFIGPGKEVNSRAIKKAIEEAGYPIDRIELCRKPLPRDARHKSKLQVEELVG